MEKLKEVYKYDFYITYDEIEEGKAAFQILEGVAFPNRVWKDIEKIMEDYHVIGNLVAVEEMSIRGGISGYLLFQKKIIETINEFTCFNCGEFVLIPTRLKIERENETQVYYYHESCCEKVIESMGDHWNKYGIKYTNLGR